MLKDCSKISVDKCANQNASAVKLRGHLIGDLIGNQINVTV